MPKVTFYNSKERPDYTLNQDNCYSTFMKPARMSKTHRHQDSLYVDSSIGSFKQHGEPVNPRQEILDNFKEISRIMT